MLTDLGHTNNSFQQRSIQMCLKLTKNVDIQFVSSQKLTQAHFLTVVVMKNPQILLMHVLILW